MSRELNQFNLKWLFKTNVFIKAKQNYNFTEQNIRTLQNVTIISKIFTPNAFIC